MRLEKRSGATFKTATRESCIRFQKSASHHNTQDDAKRRVWLSGNALPCILFSKRQVWDSGLFPRIQTFPTSSKLIANLIYKGPSKPTEGVWPFIPPISSIAGLLQLSWKKIKYSSSYGSGGQERGPHHCKNLMSL